MLFARVRSPCTVNYKVKCCPAAVDDAVHTPRLLSNTVRSPTNKSVWGIIRKPTNMGASPCSHPARLGSWPEDVYFLA